MPLPGVLWIGGGTSGGKTRIARALAHRYGLTSYHVDDWELDHARRRDPQRHRGMEAWNARTLDETWVDLPVAKLVDETIAYSRERIELIEEDILPLSREGSVIAEGFQLMPEVVAPLIDSPRQAVWLLPTTRFRTETLLSTRQAWATPNRTRDPQRAQAHRIERDSLLVERIRDQALRCGLHVIEVDGSRSPAEIEAAVEKHLELR